MSFGRRLALFFVLIAIVPTLALIGMLVIVSEDSRRGKADARLGAGLETALAVYEDDAAAGTGEAEALAGDPGLGVALRAGGAAQLEAFASEAAGDPVVAVEILGPGGEVLASSGADDAIAFGEMRLTDGGEPTGTLRVSTTTGESFGAEIRRLTEREVVVSRDGVPLGATVTPPATPISPGETRDVELGQGEFRGHQLALDSGDGEALLLLGPRKEGGFLTVDRPVAVLLTGFLLLGIVFAYALARTLTGLHARVAEQAVTDPLTGLSNRRLMHEMLTAEVQRAGRFGHVLSMLVIDVDDFKPINDEAGHQQGDAVLRRIAEIVRDATRAIDITARFGGDELALVLLETDASGARALAERLRRRISEARIPARGGGETHVTVSIGAATLPDCAIDAGELIEAADQALLLAKRAGKDQVASAPALDGSPT